MISLFGIVPADFNPRSLAGATAICSADCSQYLFQSTLPRGSDFLLPAESYIPTNFNPRSLAGATLSISKKELCKNHFNPRSLAGATAQKFDTLPVLNISIHAPSRERLTAGQINRFIIIFQSTLPRGSDWAYMQSNAHQLISIHAPSRERLFILTRFSFSFPFQSTLPRGSDIP